MDHLIVVASLKAKTDKIEFIKNELLKLHSATHANDEGCIQYDLHLDNENSDEFLVFEVWESGEHLQKHSNSSHFQAFLAAVDGVCEQFNVKQMTRFS